jgi:natural product precursor
MKNQKIGKLSLKKETVSRLNMSEMSKVIGGDIIDAYTNKCYVLSNFRTIPPCTISFKFQTVNDVVVVR